MIRRNLKIIIAIMLIGIAFAWSINMAFAKGNDKTDKNTLRTHGRVSPAERKAAADRNAERGLQPGVAMKEGAGGVDPSNAPPGVVAVPHYFGPFANYANSPLPTGAVTTITVDDPGTGYTAPVVTIADVYGTGSGALASATVDAFGGIATITIDNGGTGYSAPVATITDATGTGALASVTIGGVLSGGIRKFVDSLPLLNAAGANNLGQYIPVAIPNTTTYPGADYYEIELGEYTEQMHPDLPPTTLRGYRQTNTTDATVNKFHYLGPLIVANRDKAVRIKFTNSLSTGAAGDLFIPVDETVMGAGMGPLGVGASPVEYTQNRGTLHLHGLLGPWISDGTPHQWITPANEATSYPKGDCVAYVPDMWFLNGAVIPNTVGQTAPPVPGATNNPGPGCLTFYYPNQQSARLMFYHDHALGITRLNVYVGEAAGYLLTDQVEQDLINGTNESGVNPNPTSLLPDVGIPLIIQDKTFVDATTIMAQDPNWRWGGTIDPNTNAWVPQTGDLWLPSVYMPAQNPWDMSGASAFGRWQYGPWFWPPTNNITYPPIANPYYDPNCDGMAGWCEPPMMPSVPNPSMGMEAFMDTPMVNGAVYPTLSVEPKAYRFRILNAADDRFFNLQMYVADPTVITSDGRTNTEVKMVPALKTPGYPSKWSTDGREGGVPDPFTQGPSWIQIGTEGGFLPAPVVIPNQPVNWNMNATAFNVGNVTDHSLLLGCAERADVIVDFSAYANKTLILYNDAPAAFPALDPRYDYYTGNPAQMDTGGAPTTQPGFGPNTRTIMQIKVAASAPAATYPLAALKSAFAKTATKRGVFEVSQDPIIVPQAAYNSAYNAAFPTSVAAQFVRIHDTAKTFTPIGAALPVTLQFEEKAIHDEMGAAYDQEYGRMSGLLGLELLNTSNLTQNIILYDFNSPPVEVLQNSTAPIGVLGDGTQIWKVTHNGVDTHPIHVHLFNAQLINRVAWDGALLPPEPNELGWKETIRMNPLESTIIAFRPKAPVLPFDLPNSIRLINPSMPENAPLMGPPGGFVDPQLNAVEVLNHYVNYGWEYVWHCHILSHEEMDMMHAIAFTVAPRDPTGLAGTWTGTGAAQQVNLTWMDNSLNETSFIIQRADAAAGPFVDIATVPSVLAGPTTGVRNYTDLIPNTTATTYYYQVVARNTVGDTEVYPAPAIGFPIKTLDSAFTAATVTAPLPLPPAAPTNLTAAVQAGPQVLLTWMDNATDETGFVIERSINGGAFAVLNGAVPANAGIGNTTYTDSTVTAGNTYTYQVLATNANGNSGYSNTATVTIVATPPPAAPTNLTAVVQNGPQILLTWRDNATNETGFVIERSVNGGAFAVLTTRPARTGTGNVTYTNTGVTAGNTYAYRVMATNAGVNSAYSNTATVTITNAPTTPSNVRVRGVRTGTTANLTVTWRDNSNNETGFTIQRATNAAFNTNLVTTTVGANVTTSTITGLPRGTNFYIRVRADNGPNSSAWVNASPLPIRTP